MKMYGRGWLGNENLRGDWNYTYSMSYSYDLNPLMEDGSAHPFVEFSLCNKRLIWHNNKSHTDRLINKLRILKNTIQEFLCAERGDNFYKVVRQLNPPEDDGTGTIEYGIYPNRDARNSWIRFCTCTAGVQLEYIPEEVEVLKNMVKVLDSIIILSENIS